MCPANILVRSTKEIDCTASGTAPIEAMLAIPVIPVIRVTQVIPASPVTLRCQLVQAT